MIVTGVARLLIGTAKDVTLLSVLSCVLQVLVEQSLIGWKEFERPGTPAKRHSKAYQPAICTVLSFCLTPCCRCLWSSR
jgi:hypothetical protein